MAGDCLNSGSYNCGADIDNSTIKNQSPTNETAAKAYKAYTMGTQHPTGKPVASGHQISQKLKFTTIFKQRDLKFDVSNNLLVLIQYSLYNGEIKKYNYKRVINPTRIQEFEKRGFKWVVQNVDLSCDFFVLRQVDLEYNRYTGIIKIVKMTDAIVKQWATTRIEANPGDWIYYEKG